MNTNRPILHQINEACQISIFSLFVCTRIWLTAVVLSLPLYPWIMWASKIKQHGNLINVLLQKSGPGYWRWPDPVVSSFNVGTTSFLCHLDGNVHGWDVTARPRRAPSMFVRPPCHKHRPASISRYMCCFWFSVVLYKETSSSTKSEDYPENNKAMTSAGFNF